MQSRLGGALQRFFSNAIRGFVPSNLCVPWDPFDPDLSWSAANSFGSGFPSLNGFNKSSEDFLRRARKVSPQTHRDF